MSPEPTFSVAQLKVVKWGLGFMIPLIIVSFFGTFVIACYFAGWAVYLSIRLLAWAIRQDRKDRFEQRFIDDFKDIEERVIGLFKKPTRRLKRLKKPGTIRGIDGEYMACILCGERANAGGRFCNEHEEDNPFYRRPGTGL